MVEFRIDDYFTRQYLSECKNGVCVDISNGRRMMFDSGSDVPTYIPYEGEKSKYIKKKLRKSLLTATYEADRNSVGICIWKATAVSKHGPDWSKCKEYYICASSVTSFSRSFIDRELAECLELLDADGFVDDILYRWNICCPMEERFANFPKSAILKKSLGINCTAKTVFHAIISNSYADIVNGIDRLKSQKFGIELEFTGLTRRHAAQVIAQYIEGTVQYNGGVYDSYFIVDKKGRKWKVVRDSSIKPHFKNGMEAGDEYKCEFVTPVCDYTDIPDIQQMVRNLRRQGMCVNSTCGIHVHVDGTGHNARSLKNLSNIMANKEELIFKALSVEENRSSCWCKRIDPNFIARLNSRSNYKDIKEIERIWYNGDITSSLHYNSTRYHALNLHSLWQGKGIEFRMFNSTTHAGKVKAYIQLSLAISNYSKSISKAKSISAYSAGDKTNFGSWLSQIGLNGDEFETARLHLLANLTDNIISIRSIAA